MNTNVLQRELSGATPERILERSGQVFGPAIAMSSSFQSQSVPLLHMVSRVVPELPIVFLDTGFHFPETLEFRDRLVRDWGLNLRVARAEMDRADFRRRYGDDLYRRDPDLCCYLNKVEPMRLAVQGLAAWISGIRRDQTSSRAEARVVEPDGQGLVRVHPLLEWTERDVWAYIDRHELPVHPLLNQGYVSIGCAPCTRPVLPGEDSRAGRWSDTDKTECGLHYPVQAPGIKRRSAG